MMDTLGSVNNCFVRQVLDEFQIELLRVPTKMHEAYEEAQ